jgi:methionyl-tRNA formyltransferase
MGKKGLMCLEEMITSKHPDLIDMVVVAKDESIDCDYYSEITEMCDSNNISSIDRKQIGEASSPYLIAISWRWLIKASTTQKIIVFHDSLLPKYRGFAPLVNSLINKENKIGVTALLAADDYDKGDIIAQESIDIKYPIKIVDAIEQIIPCYQKLLVNIIQTIKAKGEIKAIRQNETNASYSIWLDEDDYTIDWNRDSIFIKRFIDSVGFPYNCASTSLKDKKVRILDAAIFEDVKVENRHPGKIIFVKNGKPVVICGSGLIQLNSIIDDDTKEELLPLANFRIKFH